MKKKNTDTQFCVIIFSVFLSGGILRVRVKKRIFDVVEWSNMMKSSFCLPESSF